MTQVLADDYKGPERRRELVIGSCRVHSAHEAKLEQHSGSISVLKEDMKTKISWKLFSLFVGIVVVSTGFLYREIRATGAHMESRLEAIDDRVEKRLDSLDKNLQVTIMREQFFEQTTNEALSEIKSIMREIDNNVRRHLEDTRALNGQLSDNGD